MTTTLAIIPGVTGGWELLLILALVLLLFGPKRLPEIAEAMGSPAHEVMYWVMAARKYGLVAEVKDPDDDYFQYELVEKK